MKPRAPAIFTGLQPRLTGEPIELYLLTEDIPGHPRRSTVSRQTLEKAGYEVLYRFTWSGRDAMSASCEGQQKHSDSIFRSFRFSMRPRMGRLRMTDPRFLRLSHPDGSWTCDCGARFLFGEPLRIREKRMVMEAREAELARLRNMGRWLLLSALAVVGIWWSLAHVWLRP